MRRAALALGALVGLLGNALSCLNKLDEQHVIDHAVTNDASSGGTGGSAGQSGTAGASGISGSAGTSGGSAGSAGAAGTDSGPAVAQFFPYDMSKYPVSDIGGSLIAPVLLAVDASYAYRVTKNADPTTLQSYLVALPLTPPAASIPIYPGLQQPQALATSPTTAFVYVAGGSSDFTSGSLWRIMKNPADAAVPAEQVQVIVDGGPAAIELAVGIAVGSDAVYADAKSAVAGKPSVMRFDFGNGSNAQVIYYSELPNETGGEITASKDCVYWISNGEIWVIQALGSSRRRALVNQVTDVTAITSDDQNFYYARSTGEIWQRQLAPIGCQDDTGPTEQKIAEGFSQIGDIVAYESTVAWTAKGSIYQAAANGGVFTTPAGGIDITQVAPGDGGPEQLDQSPTVLVFATRSGSGSQGTLAKIRVVPKHPL